MLLLDNKTPLARARDAAWQRCTILGPIDTGLLAFGTPGEVDVACREAVATMRAGEPYLTGFILGPGCALPPETPADNIHALVAAAIRYGRND